MNFHIFCYINFCNNIYSCISCNQFHFWSWLSEWAVETVSDLFLVCPTDSISSLSGILYCLLQSIVLCLEMPRALSSSFVIKIWTSNCPGIAGGVLPKECSLIRWYRALYFHMVEGSPETAVGQRGQWIGTYVHGRIQLLFCTATQNSDMGN